VVDERGGQKGLKSEPKRARLSVFDQTGSPRGKEADEGAEYPSDKIRENRQTSSTNGTRKKRRRAVLER